MSTKVEESIEVNLPVSTVYNMWTQFEDFPRVKRYVGATAGSLHLLGCGDFDHLTGTSPHEQ